MERWINFQYSDTPPLLFIVDLEVPKIDNIDFDTIRIRAHH